MTNIPIKSAIYIWANDAFKGYIGEYTKKYVAQDICTTYYKYKD